MIEPAPRQDQEERSKLNNDGQTASRQNLISTVRNRCCIYTRDAKM